MAENEINPDSFSGGCESRVENGCEWFDLGPTTRKSTDMDGCCCAGSSVTPRAGYAVEINALWYNAVCYMLKLAEEAKDNTL